LAANFLVHSNGLLPFQGPVKESDIVSASKAFAYNVAVLFGKHYFFNPILEARLLPDENELLKNGDPDNLNDPEKRILNKFKFFLNKEDTTLYDLALKKKKALDKFQKLRIKQDNYKVENEARKRLATTLLEDAANQTVQHYNGSCNIS
jgi:hypothetical protein